MEYSTNWKVWYTCLTVSFIQVRFLVHPHILLRTHRHIQGRGNFDLPRIPALIDIQVIYPPYRHDVRSRAPERRNTVLWREGFTSPIVLDRKINECRFFREK